MANVAVSWIYLVPYQKSLSKFCTECLEIVRGLSLASRAAVGFNFHLVSGIFPDGERSVRSLLVLDEHSYCDYRSSETWERSWNAVVESHTGCTHSRLGAQQQELKPTTLQ